MKKQLCALLLCLFLLAALPLAAFAEEPSPPALTIACARTGDTLTVTVGIEHNPGLAGFDLALHYRSEVLTPAAAPEIAAGWECTATNFASCDGALKVVAANQTDITGDGMLFTATFTVSGSGSYGLSAGGTACAQSADTLITLPQAYADEFAVQSVGRSEGGVTAEIVSYGTGYHGAAKAILSCYRSGKFVGCQVQSITIRQNGKTAVSFTASGGEDLTWRLLLTDSQFTPLHPATDIP